ncbi:MAG TPA: hypothetical protein VK706_05330 [Candidatus Sulfotelmatobacter sp.]|nr:hypothetical protein [Candidatus Sulfotelmatobacter sp.]
MSDPQYQAPRSHAVPGIAHDQRYSVDQSELRIGALIALRVSPALGGDKGWRPFPRTPFSASSILPSLRFGQVSLDEAEHFLHNRDASVATLRWCSGHPGMPFGFIPDLVFGFTSIWFSAPPTSTQGSKIPVPLVDVVIQMDDDIDAGTRISCPTNV